MHKLNVQIFGPSSFFSTLNELKIFLKFNILSDNTSDKPHIILFHIDALQDKKQENYIKRNNVLKICATDKKEFKNNWDAKIDLPTTLKEINAIVESAFVKKKFNKNSSIKIKSYLLDKNEKKLSKLDDFIILTEKEVQLLQLLLDAKKPVQKNNILSTVWKYSTDVDTHTVETHVYRLRKKILNRFKDEKFILNNKDGYYL
tara:strand:+ start:5698 stop:6303 length:606 start_codon:yes stop_codon:yes gene_type:complete